jgi:hypothetical protein
MNRRVQRKSARDKASVRGQGEPNAPAALLDQFLETYASWREGCADVTTSYARWTDADRSDRGHAFVAYYAALDREESAARSHERSTMLLRAGLAAGTTAALALPR